MSSTHECVGIENIGPIRDLNQSPSIAATIPTDTGSHADFSIDHITAWMAATPTAANSAGPHSGQFRSNAAFKHAVLTRDSSPTSTMDGNI